MSAGLLFVFPVVTILVLLGVVLVAVPRRRQLVAINERDFPELARLRNVNSVARIVGLAVGLIVIIPTMTALRFGLGVFLAPAIFAATQILATLVAGVVTHNAARTPGTAGLEVRSIRPYLPASLTAAALSATLILGLVLAWTTATAVPDDMGNPGRQFSYSYQCVESAVQSEGVCSRGSSPWPGSFYSIPVGVALAIVLALAVAAVIATVRRPRNASDPEIVRVDDCVRARTVETIVAAVGVASAGTLVGVSLLVANFLGNPSNPTPLLLRLPGWGAVPLTVIALATAVWCTVILLLPGATAPLRQTSGDDARAESVTT